jgi:hypothetical protein
VIKNMDVCANGSLFMVDLLLAGLPGQKDRYSFILLPDFYPNRGPCSHPKTLATRERQSDGSEFG